MCCGSPNEQYCCTPSEAASQYQTTNEEENSMTVPFSTCVNYMEYDGVVYGVFNCPVFGYNIEANMCCGQVNEQFCCTQTEFIMVNTNGNQTNFLWSTSTKISQTKEEIELSDLHKVLQNTSISMNEPLLVRKRIKELEQKKLKQNNDSNLYQEFLFLHF